MKEYRVQQSQSTSPCRILRELQELSQNELAELTGIPQSTISAIERGRVNLGVERAKVLARALRCHPAVLVFPGWEVEKESETPLFRARRFAFATASRSTVNVNFAFITRILNLKHVLSK